MGLKYLELDRWKLLVRKVELLTMYDQHCGHGQGHRNGVKRVNQEPKRRKGPMADWPVGSSNMWRGQVCSLTQAQADTGRREEQSHLPHFHSHSLHLEAANVSPTELRKVKSVEHSGVGTRRASAAERYT